MADPQIRAILRTLERVSERVIVKITLDVTANLIETTPVDTGWARANWVPAIGAAVDNAAPFVSANNIGPQVNAQSAALANVASTYKLSRGSVFVSNNVPYILGLNDGNSDQAPRAFVQMAIAKAVTQDIKGLTSI